MKTRQKTSLVSHSFIQSIVLHRIRVLSVFVLSLGLLWVSRAALGLTQRADRSIPVNLLVAGQTGLHGRWLLLAEMPLPRRAPLIDQLLCGSCCCS